MFDWTNEGQYDMVYIEIFIAVNVKMSRVLRWMTTEDRRRK